MRSALREACKSGLSLFLALTLVTTITPPPVMAQQGGTIRNGTTSAPAGIVLPGFLFEPEVPLASLKEVPIWNELEQLLDNPYNVALCSALPASVEPLVRNTPGTTSIAGSPPPLAFPAYCTTSAVVRRAGFGVSLPPLMMHPLNYNATTGEEMRLLNLAYPGGNWVVPGPLLRCGSAPGTTQLPPG